LRISLPCKYLFNNVGAVTEITNSNNVDTEKNPKNDIESATGIKNRTRLSQRKHALIGDSFKLTKASHRAFSKIYSCSSTDK
jgi:hypothetical protein